MKRFLCILLAALTAFCISGCKTQTDGVFDKDNELNGFFKGYGEVADEGKTAAVYNGEDVEVSKIVTQNGKTFIEVEGEPFAYIGASIRTDAFMNCDLYTYEELEVLFKEAKELGVTCVQVPVEWKDMENEKDQWDFSYLHSILIFANRYDLKMELLWFGTNMVGDTHSNTVPDYILRDGKTYKKLDALRTGEYWNYYGLMWYLDFNDPDLMEREANAVKKMMDYVYQWDSEHGGKKPVIGVQVLNEADAFFRWRIDQYSVKDPLTGEIMSYEEGLKKVSQSLDYLGKAVKSCKYKVYTRTNLADSTGGSVYEGGLTGTENVKDLPDFARAFFDLEGIDIVGDDSYKDDISVIKGIAYMYGQKTEGNFAHFAENDGSYSRTPQLILTAFSVGAGYSIYDLCTSPYYVDNRASGSADDVDQGILSSTDNRKVYERKDHYEQTKAVIEGLKAAGEAAVKAPMEDFAAFGVKNNLQPVGGKYVQTINTTSVTVEAESSEMPLGYAIEFEGKLYIYMLQETSIRLSNATFETPEFTAEAGKLYTLEFTEGAALQSTVWENIG